MFLLTEIDAQADAHDDDDRLQNAQFPAEQNEDRHGVSDDEDDRQHGVERDEQIARGEQQNYQSETHREDQRRVSASDHFTHQIVEQELRRGEPPARKRVEAIRKDVRRSLPVFHLVVNLTVGPFGQLQLLQFRVEIILKLLKILVLHGVGVEGDVHVDDEEQKTEFLRFRIGQKSEPEIDRAGRTIGG